jgi:hypothetical protein
MRLKRLIERDEALARVDRLITECQHLIDRQREAVSNAAGSGRDPEIAQSMLRVFEASLKAFERYRQ